MWKQTQQKKLNYAGIKRIAYYCTDEDLGKKKGNTKDIHRKAYRKIFEQQALNNMKDRLKNLNQYQTQIKQQSNEKEAATSQP